jgi:2-polyprenyl-6-methoxyphenol hydroxylase-like FAD-dependent oxidoreductase
VRFGQELIGVEQNADAVTAQVMTATGAVTHRGRYLVAADGGRSFVRHALQIGFPGETLGVRAVVADVTLEGLTRDASHHFNEGDMGRQLYLTPLAGTDLFQFQAPVPLEGDVDLSPQGLTRMARERSGRRDIIIREVSWASAFTMNARLADRYREGRIFLVGDAAHVHPPTGGQGLNTSVQDAYNLGWKLDAVLSGAPPTLLDSYETERRPIAESVLGLSTKLLEELRTGARRRGREVQQLDLAYPDTPLSLESPPRRHGLLAGDRAPDAPVRRAAGQTTRAFLLMQGTHWTLFGYGVGPECPVAPRKNLRIHTFGPRGDLIDDGGHFRDGYGVSPGEWVLVRPDGYVAAIVDGAHLADLEAHLCNMIG